MKNAEKHGGIKWYAKPLAVKWGMFMLCLAVFAILVFCWYTTASQYVTRRSGGVAAFLVSPVEVLVWPVAAVAFAMWNKFFLALGWLAASAVWLHWWLTFRTMAFDVVALQDTPLLWMVAPAVIIGVTCEVVQWQMTERRAEKRNGAGSKGCNVERGAQ